MRDTNHDSAGAWAKKYHMASRAAIDATLRPHDLGSTQWYVLWYLVNVGGVGQRDLIPMLQVEKATLSGVVAALVRKGLVNQAIDPKDQRQKLLSITPIGRTLWESLPCPIDLILKTAFEGFSEEDLATVVRVLSTGTQRLNKLLQKGKQS